MRGDKAPICPVCGVLGVDIRVSGLLIERKCVGCEEWFVETDVAQELEKHTRADRLA